MSNQELMLFNDTVEALNVQKYTSALSRLSRLDNSWRDKKSNNNDQVEYQDHTFSQKFQQLLT